MTRNMRNGCNSSLRSALSCFGLALLLLLLGSCTEAFQNPVLSGSTIHQHHGHAPFLSSPHLGKSGRSAGRYSMNSGRVVTTATTTTASITTTTTTIRLYVVSSVVLETIDQFWQTSPYTAAALVCGFKASAADWVAQRRDYLKREEKERKIAKSKSKKQKLAQDDSIPNANSNRMDVLASYDVSTTSPEASEQQKEDKNRKSGTVVQQMDSTSQSSTRMSRFKKSSDWQRNVAFLAYGAVYQGMAQEFIYNHLYPVWFGSETTPLIVLSKVLFDLCIQTTLVTLPIAYLTKSVIYQYSFQEALRRYIDDVKNHGLLKKYFTLWGPVQCITFSIIPEHYRVTFVAFVSFFWLITLSSIASKKRTTATTTTTTTTATTTTTKTTTALATSATATVVASAVATSTTPTTVNTDSNVEEFILAMEEMENGEVDDIDDEDDFLCSLEDGLTCSIDG